MQNAPKLIWPFRIAYKNFPRINPAQHKLERIWTMNAIKEAKKAVPPGLSVYFYHWSTTNT